MGALQCMGLDSPSVHTKVRLHLGDGRDFLSRRETVPDYSLDAVLVDVFETEGREPNCLTNTVWAHLVKRKLKQWGSTVRYANSSRATNTVAQRCSDPALRNGGSGDRG